MDYGQSILDPQPGGHFVLVQPIFFCTSFIASNHSQFRPAAFSIPLLIKAQSEPVPGAAYPPGRMSPPGAFLLVFTFLWRLNCAPRGLDILLFDPIRLRCNFAKSLFTMLRKLERFYSFS